MSFRIDKKGSYCVIAQDYELTINYSYYYWRGDYFQPPEFDLEIDSVELNDMDITGFYFDWLHTTTMEENIIEHARSNS